MIGAECAVGGDEVDGWVIEPEPGQTGGTVDEPQSQTTVASGGEDQLSEWARDGPARLMRLGMRW